MLYLLCRDIQSKEGNES
jgi:hypothetical protein